MIPWSGHVIDLVLRSLMGGDRWVASGALYGVCGKHLAALSSDGIVVLLFMEILFRIADPLRGESTRESIGPPIALSEIFDLNFISLPGMLNSSPYNSAYMLQCNGSS